MLALIPLDLDGYIFTDGWQSGKKDQVLSRLAADFKVRDDDKFEAELEMVVRALRTDEGGREAPPDPRF